MNYTEGYHMKLARIYEAAESEYSYLTNEECIKVSIGASACQAAGFEIFDSFQTEIEKLGIKATAIKTGSFGYYDLEPLVLIEKPGKAAIFYRNVSPEMVSDLVNEYLINDEIRDDIAFCSLGENEIKGIPDTSNMPLFTLQNTKPTTVASGLISMGFLSMLLARSMKSLSPSLISPGIGGRRNPALSSSSVAMTLAPPPFPTAQVLNPPGGLTRRSATRISTISSMLCVLIAPTCMRRPSQIASAPARDPVCEAAALDPPAV